MDHLNGGNEFIVIYWCSPGYEGIDLESWAGIVHC